MIYIVHNVAFESVFVHTLRWSQVKSLIYLQLETILGMNFLRNRQRLKDVCKSIWASQMLSCGNNSSQRNTVWLVVNVLFSEKPGFWGGRGVKWNCEMSGFLSHAFALWASTQLIRNVVSVHHTARQNTSLAMPANTYRCSQSFSHFPRLSDVCETLATLLRLIVFVYL